MTDRPGLQTVKIQQEEVDEHIFVMIECPDRPTISLDLHNMHGRRSLGVRTNGNGIASVVVDVDWKEPRSDRIDRYCPYCGEELSLVSSKSHRCEGG